MTTNDQLVALDLDDIETEPREDSIPSVGQWFWVGRKDDMLTAADDSEDEQEDSKPQPWLGCVVSVGSNYVELSGIREEPEDKVSQASYAYRGGIVELSTRVHFDNIDSHLQKETQAEKYIAGRVENRQQAVRRLMGKVQELTAKLGCSPREQLAEQNETSALVLSTSTQPVEDYKKDLVLAVEKGLPDLFGRIEGEHKALAVWMTASTLALQAQSTMLKGSLKQVKNRIFAVELYAGLTEDIAEVCGGRPAAGDEPIRLLQRRCYMDEECLARYEAGGMEFHDITKFDAWLAKPENRDRLLPFQRCVVAFRVRRNTKERDAVNIRAFINIMVKEKEDLTTFLYMRNGERVYRLNTELEFGEKLFPDLDRMQMTQKLWARMYTHTSVANIITDADRTQMMAERKAALEKEKLLPELPNPGYWESKEEHEKHPDEAGYKAAKEAWTEKYNAMRVRDEEKRHLRDLHENVGSYIAFDSTSVHYDDIAKHIADLMTKHNRLVLVLQGLLDRSPVFHPHPPWQIHQQAGFEMGLRLVLDQDRALVAGDKPDFEAYRRRLNSSLRKGSWTVGQQYQWLLHEGEKESKRREADYRWRGETDVKTFQPEGNPGPGDVALVSAEGRGGKMYYEWQRERLRVAKRLYRWSPPPKNDPINCAFACSIDDVLNVDAYQPGDFKIFFQDPRTRAEYLQWAPLLLRAEDFKAKLVEPSSEPA